MTQLANSILQLTVSLSLIRDPHELVQQFVARLNSYLPSLSFTWIPAGKQPPLPNLPISSEGYTFGHLHFSREADFSQEWYGPVRNAAQLVAILLDKLNRELLLDSDSLAPALQVSDEEQAPYNSTELPRKSEATLSRLIQNLPGFVYRCAADENWTMHYVSQGFDEITGYSREEVLLNRDIAFNDIIHPDHREYLFTRWEEVLRFQDQFESEYRIIRKDGTIRWVWERGRGVFCRNNNNLIFLEGFITDITEKRQAEERWHVLSRAVEQNPASIMITDAEGRVEFVNKTFSDFTHYTLEELIGKPPRIFNPGHVDEEAFRAMWEALRSGNTWRGEIENRTKDGERFWQLVSINPLLDSEAKLTNYILTMEDVTDRKRLLDGFIAAKEKAEESDRLKSAFLHNLSHEVRTPMNAIMGFARLLDNPELTPEKSKTFADTIIQSGQDLLTIITDMINMATIEAEQLSLHQSVMHLNNSMQVLYNNFEKMAQYKRLTFELHKGLPDEAAILLADEAKLFQVLHNLLHNAFKFTKSGYVKFGYDLDGDILKFFVIDSGIGIPLNAQESIFQKFRQAELSLNREFGGSGLGLAISKAYAELMGGNISVISSPGEGSIFTVSIPFKLPPVSEIQQLKSPIRELTLFQSTTILVAEDEDLNYLLIKELLSRLSLTILRAENGKMAVELVRKHPEINLILMDIRMPVMDGFEATQIIRAEHPDMPVIAITAYAHNEEEQKVHQSGFSDYISKPFSAELLIARIREQLTKTESR
ncbi:MAG: PAS domain S-box protein [Bacteroidales bacterium]